MHPYRPRILLSGLVMLLSAACSPWVEHSEAQSQPPPPVETPRPGEVTAVFAGGCFWCMESPFESLPGVSAVISGYSGGPEAQPTYRQVSSGRTGHAEAVQVHYDPERVTYAELLEVFWHNIDPTQANGQFCDRGRQYRSAIFYADESERELALASRETVQNQLNDARIVTEIVSAGTFWPAEAYHQDYYRTHPARYRRYRTGCGRDRRLQQLWGASAH